MVLFIKLIAIPAICYAIPVIVFVLALMVKKDDDDGARFDWKFAIMLLLVSLLSILILDLLHYNYSNKTL